MVFTHCCMVSVCLQSDHRVGVSRAQNNRSILERSIIIAKVISIQFSPLTDWTVRGDMIDDPAEILFQSFLQEAPVSSSGMGRDVHSLMLSIQYFLCCPGCRPPSKMP